MILVTGGIKSGKSSIAVAHALSFREPRVFIATAVPFDQEMQDKIRRHKQEREDAFVLHEEPLHIGEVLRKVKAEVYVIDCITMWVGNLLHADKNVENEVKLLVDALTGREIVVTNEVGLGIIPDNKLARMYTNYLGYANKLLAARADEVWLMVAGVKVKIK